MDNYKVKNKLFSYIQIQDHFLQITYNGAHSLLNGTLNVENFAVETILTKATKFKWCYSSGYCRQILPELFSGVAVAYGKGGILV